MLIKVDVMRKNWIILLLFLSAVVFHACQNEKQDTPPENEKNNDVKSILKNASPEIRKAIEWFRKHEMVDPVSGGIQGEHPLFENMVPKWSSAFVQEGKENQVAVEVPLQTCSRLVFALPENAIAYDATKNSMYIQSLTHLVILTKKDNGSISGFFMTLIPSKKYMDAKNFDVFRSTYFVREKDFDGYIYFHELDGSFANGWCYANGKITHRVNKAEHDSAHSREKGEHTYCIPTYRMYK